MSNEFIERVLGREQSKNFRRKISDIVAKVSFCCGKEKEEKMVYIILEHQSSVDYAMSDRLFEYTNMLKRHIRNSKMRRHHWVYPIVLYTGAGKWPEITTEDENIPSIYRQIFEYPVIDVRALEEDKILNSSGRVAAYFYLSRYGKNLNDDNRAEFKKHLLNILQHDAGNKAKESLLIMSDLLYNTHVSKVNVNNHTMEEVVNMITKEGIEIVHPWQLDVYNDLQAKVHAEVQAEIRQKLQEGLQKGLQKGLQEGLQEGRQEGLQEGRQEGEMKGHMEERRKNARSMFSIGLSADDVQKVTGLSDEEMRTLQNGAGKNGSL